MAYRWHPLHGQEVTLDKPARSPDRQRIRLTDQPKGLGIEIPTWMLDEEACAAMTQELHPRVDQAAYAALRALLDDRCAGREVAMIGSRAMKLHRQLQMDLHEEESHRPRLAELESVVRDEVVGLLARLLLARAAGEREESNG